MPFADQKKYREYQRAYRERPENKARARVRQKAVEARRDPFVQASYVKATVANARSGQKITGAELRALPHDACAYCGRPGPTQIDHCTPLARGGENTVDNIVWCCQSCNSRKADRTVLEFMCHLPRLGRPRRASGETIGRDVEI